MRALVFIGTSLADVKSFPDDVQDEAGHALWIAQEGGRYVSAKPLKGFGEPGRDRDRRRRRLSGGLHRGAEVGGVRVACLSKKSTRGVATAQRDIDLIKQRLREAQARENAHG